MGQNLNFIYVERNPFDIKFNIINVARHNPLALGRTYVPWSMRPQQQQPNANNTATTPRQTAVADSFNFLRPSSSGAPSTSSSFVSSCSSDPPTPTATPIATATTTATGKGKGKGIAKVVVPSSSSSSSSSSSKSSSVDDWIRRLDTAAFFNDPRRDNPWTLPSGSTASSSSCSSSSSSFSSRGSSSQVGGI